ncbi:hypothetical protein J6590_073408 [Homalodisca vitripennis]|nr:hypothetical protein J6590_073408 [Homalodisca vitripennis]
MFPAVQKIKVSLSSKNDKTVIPLEVPSQWQKATVTMGITLTMNTTIMRSVDIIDAAPSRVHGFFEVPRTGTGGGGRGRRLRAANQFRVNRTALPFSYPHVTPQSQSLLSNRFVRFAL